MESIASSQSHVGSVINFPPARLTTCPLVSSLGLDDLTKQLVRQIAEFLQDAFGPLGRGASYDPKNYQNHCHVLFNSAFVETQVGVTYSIRVPPTEWFLKEEFSDFFSEVYIGKMAIPAQAQGKAYEFMLRMWLKPGKVMPRKAMKRAAQAIIFWMALAQDMTAVNSGRPPLPEKRREQVLFVVSSRELYVDFKVDRHQQVHPSQAHAISSQYDALMKALKVLLGRIAERFVDTPHTFLAYPSVRLIRDQPEALHQLALQSYSTSLLKDFFYDVMGVAISQLESLKELVPRLSEDVFEKFSADILSADVKENILKAYYSPKSSGEYELHELAGKYLTNFFRGGAHIHPGFSAWFRSAGNIGYACSQVATDLLVFDTSYITLILHVAQWVRRVLLAPKDKVKNTASVLLLYGDSGAGKSQLVHILQQIFKVYRWKLGASYHSASLYDAQLIVLEDIKLEDLLRSSDNKNLLDYENPQVVEMKYMAPVPLTNQCPVIITTNDNLDNLTRNTKVGQDHVAAFRRRVFPVGCYGKYQEKHVQQDGVKAEVYQDFKDITQQALLNSILALAILMEDQPTGCPWPNLHLDRDVTQYYGTILSDFARTAFCRVFLDGGNRGVVLKCLRTYYESSQSECFQQSALEQIFKATAGGLDRLIQRYSASQVKEDPVGDHLMANSFTVNNLYRAAISKSLASRQPLLPIHDYVNNRIEYGTHAFLMEMQAHYDGPNEYESINSQSSVASAAVLHSSTQKTCKQYRDGIQSYLGKRAHRDSFDQLFDGDDVVAELVCREAVQETAHILTESEKRLRNSVVVARHSVARNILADLNEEEKKERQQQEPEEDKAHYEPERYLDNPEQDQLELIAADSVFQPEAEDEDFEIPLEDLEEACNSNDGTARNSQA